MTLVASVAATPPTTAIIGTPPQPNWVQLSAPQQVILAPLAKDWDRMENIRKKKWLGIAERYPAMKLSEQQRMQERMREWANLTPEQRAKVRDSYKDFKQLPADQKKLVKQKWEAYSSLPADEKQRFRETGKSARLLVPPVETATPTELDNLTAGNAENATSTTPVANEAIKNR